MRVLLGVLFVVGAVLGIGIGFAIFVVSLIRGKRAVHAEGVVCRATVTARDQTIGPRLAGPALVRLSGAFGSPSDVLGFELRLQRTASDDPAVGDQDLLLASFESFATAARDKAATNTGDYLANKYSSVTPWWIPGLGPRVLRIPPLALPAGRGADRASRLAADLRDGTAAVSLVVDGAAVAEVRLTEQLTVDDRALRASLMRQGRGLRPLGLRNGIRWTVYPLGQAARRLRGG